MLSSENIQKSHVPVDAPVSRVTKEEKDCVICQGLLTGTGIKGLSSDLVVMYCCGKPYHKACFVENYKSLKSRGLSVTCPNCRHAITEKKLLRLPSYPTIEQLHQSLPVICSVPSCKQEGTIEQLKNSTTECPNTQVNVFEDLLHHLSYS
jgi:hypothetical protein